MAPLKSLQTMLIVSEIIVFLSGLLLSRIFGFSMLYTYIPMIVFFFVFMQGIFSYANKHGSASRSLMEDE